MSSPLFERQSTGGSVARNGFDYQDAFLLQHLPVFLARGAFSHAVSELLGDLELRYFRPTGGTFCVLYEAKRNQLTMRAIWAEISRFRQLHDQAPDEYVQFVLVCGDFNGDLSPLFGKLEKYRGPAGSLNADSHIRASAEADIEATIVSFGQTIDIARFVLERVFFVEYDDKDVVGAFSTLLTKNLPEVSDMRGGEATAFMARCKELVNASQKGVVTRATIESALLAAAPSVAQAWLAVPSDLNLLSQTRLAIGPLALDVTQFNGDQRGALSHGAWSEMQQCLVAVSEFLRTTRARRGVRVSAKQRMSLSCLVGYCFSATRGFTLALNHNGQIFDTANHKRSEEVFFAVQEDAVSAPGREGIASISFPYDGKADVLASAKDLSLGEAPKLVLASKCAVTDIETLNTAVHEAKSALMIFRAHHQLSSVHLFIRAPSMFAMAFGHRLNGIGPMQLYDWIDGRYRPTVLLA